MPASGETDTSTAARSSTTRRRHAGRSPRPRRAPHRRLSPQRIGRRSHGRNGHRHEFLPGWRHRHHFRAGLRSSPELYDYAQTKAATMNYVKSLAKQLGPKGIRVNGVAPDPIWTPLQVSGGASMESSSGSVVIRRWIGPGQPTELGSIYVQLAATDASFATGQSLWFGRRIGATLSRSPLRMPWACTLISVSVPC